MEIARTLHADLTSGVVAEARRPLGELAFALGQQEGGQVNLEETIRATGLEAEEIRHHYFVLLWCFERIWAGYQVISVDRLLGQRPRNEFASLIEWHVRNWSGDLPAVKSALGAKLGEVHDSDSAEAFGKLGDAILSPESTREIRDHLIGRALTPVGRPKWWTRLEPDPPRR